MRTIITIHREPQAVVISRLGSRQVYFIENISDQDTAFAVFFFKITKRRR